MPQYIVIIFALNSQLALRNRENKEKQYLLFTISSGLLSFFEIWISFHLKNFFIISCSVGSTGNKFSQLLPENILFHLSFYFFNQLFIIISFQINKKVEKVTPYNHYLDSTCQHKCKACIPNLTPFPSDTGGPKSVMGHCSRNCLGIL